MRLPFLRRRPPGPLPAAAPVPLHTPGSTPAPGTVPLTVALRIAREAIGRHKDANIHSRLDMYFAAVDLDHAARLLVDALDHPQDR
ncbi:hypothetical protein ACF09L_32710 [Streptomyces sp. NPDC014779]|uniref:hypothetical protein n=1 Tax=Streptomyces sp. NPDC014779 TaxID=3364911 RepID=UPI0036F8E644